MLLLKLKGDGNNDGNITLANSKIDLQSAKIEINGKQKVGCYSEQKIDMQSQGTLQMYGAQASCRLHHLGMDNVARHKKHQLRRRINYGMDE